MKHALQSLLNDTLSQVVDATSLSSPFVGELVLGGRLRMRVLQLPLVTLGKIRRSYYSLSTIRKCFEGSTQMARRNELEEEPVAPEISTGSDLL